MPEKTNEFKEFSAKLQAFGLELVRLSQCPAARRGELLNRYDCDVYQPAFPDAAIREEPAYWLGLLDAAPYPPPPQPLIDVLLLVAQDGAVAAGVTVEFYRTAQSGLLTYISVAAAMRGKGIGCVLVAAAQLVLEQMAGSTVPMFAETERLEDAETPEERAATVLRQRQLSGLGAKLIGFDYVMPPLRPDSHPHRLHLLVFDPTTTITTVPARQIAALLTELAAALDANLAADSATAAMMERLGQMTDLQVGLLPVFGAP